MYKVSIGKLIITSSTIKGLEKLLYTYLRYADVQKTIKLAIAAKAKQEKNGEETPDAKAPFPREAEVGAREIAPGLRAERAD
jgi:hypothetical protein